MKNRMNALTRPIAPTAGIERPGKTEVGSRSPDRLLSRFRGALLVAPFPTKGELIFFREGSSALDGRARAALRDWSTVLRANPGTRIVIGGLASAVGSTADAMELALQRVEAIRAFLRSQDVDPTRIGVAIRGAEWFLVERPRRVADRDPSGECRLQITDPQWALWRS